MNLKQVESILSLITPETKLTVHGELLLSTTEYLLGEYHFLKNKVQQLKDEIKKLKREKGKPYIKANTKEISKISSEKERSKPKKHIKGFKNNRINPHRTITRCFDKTKLPSDVMNDNYS